MVNLGFTMIVESRLAVQAGTPMTATENGTLPLERGWGVFILCPQISRGVRGAEPPAPSASRGAGRG